MSYTKILLEKKEKVDVIAEILKYCYSIAVTFRAYHFLLFKAKAFIIIFENT